MRCPNCHSDELYRSRRGLPWHLRAGAIFLVAIRCHRCGRRFARSRVSARALSWPPEAVVAGSQPKRRSSARRSPAKAIGETADVGL